MIASFIHRLQQLNLIFHPCVPKQRQFGPPGAKPSKHAWRRRDVTGSPFLWDSYPVPSVSFTHQLSSLGRLASAAAHENTALAARRDGSPEVGWSAGWSRPSAVGLDCLCAARVESSNESDLAARHRTSAGSQVTHAALHEETRAGAVSSVTRLR